MDEVSIAASYFRMCRLGKIEIVDEDQFVASSPNDLQEIKLMKDKIIKAIEAGECPAGWPKYDPQYYDAQLEAKSQLILEHFPECVPIGLEIMKSPKAHHRMRAKVGIANSESAERISYIGLEAGEVDALEISSRGICAMMPLLLTALKSEPVLRQGLTMVSFLNTELGISQKNGYPQNMVACLVYGEPINELLWKEAAENQIARWKQESDQESEISLIGQAKSHRIVCGVDHVNEAYHLNDGRVLKYKHLYGHFSNPNAYACKHTLDFLTATVMSIPTQHRTKDLLELYCGGGNHTVAIAPLFRSALAVEINPSLCKCAEENLAINGVTNANVQKSPSVDFCTRVLRQRQWVHKPTGQSYEFDTVLVDPPRSGLDDLTRSLVAKYTHILYISCNPFVSFRRDLSELLQQGFTLKKMALIDHFPYTPHTELAIYLSKI
jgi:tRNA (uracil-5-)-methyltransferase